MPARHVLVASLLATVLASAASTADPFAAQLRVLQAEDARVARIGWRLRAANVDLCPSVRPELGLVLYDAAQFSPDARPVARALFGLDAPVAIGVAVEGGPAERAGLRAGDGIVAVAGEPVLRATPGATARFDGVDDALALLDRAAAGAGEGAVMLRIARDGVEREVALRPQPVCTAFVQLLPDARSEASADAQTITVSTGLLARIANDDELAFLVGHELAHVMLGHRERFARARVNKGVLAGLGSNGRLLRAAEADADRLGVHLAARAGYDPFAAAAFWHRAGRAAAPLIGDGTHPGWKSRGEATAAEARAIAAAAASTPIPAYLSAQLVERRRHLAAKAAGPVR